MKNTNIIRIAICQINTTVGDIQGNTQKIINGIQKAAQQECDIVTFPELSICGYPPEDLVLRQQFIRDQLDALQDIKKHSKNLTSIVGFIDHKLEKNYNAAAVIAHGQVQSVYHKIQLPNYSVFDEERYFQAGDSPLVLDINGIKIGISICEDIWVPNCVTESEVFIGGAELIINISASPFSDNKHNERYELMKSRAQKTHTAIIYNNLVGGQDELVFDGRSMAFDCEGKFMAEGKAFQEDFIAVDFDIDKVHQRHQDSDFGNEKSRFYFPFQKMDSCEINVKRSPKTKPAIASQPLQLKRQAEIYNALILGLKDYVIKNGFQGVVFGLSGGIDSALVAAIAADALGAENVHCLTMPSQYSSSGSVDDSVLLAKNFGIDLSTLTIHSIYTQFIETLADTFQGKSMDITEENLQARIRGNLVMAMSNKFGWMPLATGNKSEVSVGYCTIYGDMVGGYAPLKDVMKMTVYELSEYRNQLAGYDIIPRAIIDKAPSAELRPDQKDEDSLPPYPILDDILAKYIEQAMSVKNIIESGHEADIVKKVTRLVDINEYKRRQAAPGVKITPLAFGKDRRMPITNHYRA